jgi:hypothetical protein
MSGQHYGDDGDDGDSGEDEQNGVELPSVTIRWVSLGAGMQEAEVPADKIKSIEYETPGGSHNPITIQIEGHMQWHCCSIDYPAEEVYGHAG